MRKLFWLLALISLPLFGNCQSDIPQSNSWDVNDIELLKGMVDGEVKKYFSDDFSKDSLLYIREGVAGRIYTDYYHKSFQDYDSQTNKKLLLGTFLLHYWNMDGKLIA